MSPQRTVSYLSAIITDRIQRMREDNVSGLTTPVGGYPGQVQMGGTPARSSQWGTHLGYPPSQTWLGVAPHLEYPPPLSHLAGGYPCWGGYPTSGNRWSTWYAAVGMPLAFTQEDFLVKIKFSILFKKVKCKSIQENVNDSKDFLVCYYPNRCLTLAVNFNCTKRTWPEDDAYVSSNWAN